MSSHLLAVSLVALTILSTSAGSDLCPEPDIPNGGTVNSKKAENFFLGEVVCNRGYERIGNPRIRCRKGVRSGTLPVCTTTTTTKKTTATTTTSETTTTTTVAVASPVIFGARQGALLSPGEVTVFTCSTEAKSIRWMVAGLKRGEGSEEELRAGKLISSWAYTAKPGDFSVECFAVNQEGKVESSASIGFV